MTTSSDSLKNAIKKNADRLFTLFFILIIGFPSFWSAYKSKIKRVCVCDRGKEKILFDDVLCLRLTQSLDIKAAKVVNQPTNRSAAWTRFARLMAYNILQKSKLLLKQQQRDDGQVEEKQKKKT